MFLFSRLVWKLYFEAAQAEERAGNFEVCRAAYVEAVRNCPENLLWKVWLGAARTELNINNIAVAVGSFLHVRMCVCIYRYRIYSGKRGLVPRALN